MAKRVINPWTWQDTYGFVQANEITNGQRMVFCAGLVSVDENGNLLHAGDMQKQVTQILNNLEILLHQAEVTLSDIVRLIYYTTDIPSFSEAAPILINRLEKGNCKPATTLLEVKALFHPDCLVEIEATVVV